MADTLEDNSFWHAYKTQVWLQNTPEAATIHNILRVLRSIRNLDGLAYVSTPITSGEHLYERLHHNPTVKKKDIIDAVISHNYQQGWNFVENLKTKLNTPIIYPADVVPARQDWEQDHFQALWLSIIAELCSEVRMTKGWNYSNGCCEELTHAYQLRLGLPRHPNLVFYNTKNDEQEERERMKSIAVYDHNGDSISIDQAVSKMAEAAERISAWGFDTKRLERCQTSLLATKILIEKGFYQ